jgi:hypothetical protein
MSDDVHELATVLALRPSRRRKADGRRAALVLRAPASNASTDKVVDLALARRRMMRHHIEPQGGDAA